MAIIPKPIGWMAIAILLFIALYASLPGITDASITDLTAPAAPPRPITLPFSENSAVPPHHYRIDMTIHYQPLQHGVFHITPDDCIRSILVNGTPVTLDDTAKARQCDYLNGFYLDLKNYLHTGANHLTMQLEDYGGSYAIAVFPTPGMAWPLLCLLAAALLMVGIPAYKGPDNWLYVAWLIGVLAGFEALFYIKGQNFSHDFDGHMEYIHYVLAHWTHPPAHSGWEYYHPPVYYFLCAVVWKAAALLGQDPLFALHAFSLLCYFTFLTFGIMTIGISLPHGLVRNAAAFLFALWPLHVLYATAINNDILLYPVYAAGFYFLVEWHRSFQARQLAMAMLMAALSITVKSNGMILYIVIGWAVLQALAARQVAWRSLMKRSIGLAVMISLLGCAVNLWGRTDDLPWKHSGNPLLTGNASWLSKNLTVDNSLSTYAYFDYASYLKTPFFNPWENSIDRQFFWNVLLKSSLLGEYAFEPVTLCGLLNVALLSLVLFTLGAELLTKNPKRAIHAPLLIGTLVPVLCSAANRMLYATAIASDFRYIYPMLTAFVPLVMQGTGVYRERGLPVLHAAYLFCIGSMIVLEACFIISVL